MTPVIDAHHHLLDPGRFTYPWLRSGLEALDRRYGPEDLAPELARAGVDATIVVQTISSLEETRAFLAIARDVPWIAGVVGWVDLTGPELATTIADLRAGPGGDHLVGVRHQVHDEADPAWLTRRDVERGLAIVADADLTYDLLVRPRELPAALTAVRRNPSLRFVLDHLAKPPIASGDLRAWTVAFAPLADEPNARAKLSGLVTEADPGAWRPDDLAGAVEVALERFGPDRLLFGSDWPVCLLAGRYHDVIGAARTLTDDLSPADRAAIFGGTAAHAYPGLRLT